MKTSKNTHLCPVCGSRKTRMYINAFNSHGAIVYNPENQFRYYRCEMCNAIFLIGIKPDASYYQTYYNTYYRDEGTGTIGVSSLIVSYSDWVKRNLIEEYSSKAKGITLLDIGSGHGKFIESLDKKQFNATGLEIDKNLVTAYKKRGLNGLSGDFLKIDFGKRKFDIVTMWHVIEHVADAQKLFKKVHALLSPHGLFIFSTPNTDSIGLTKGKADWFHLDAPRHFVLYSETTVQYIAEKYGFEMLHIRNNYHDFPLDLFWSLRNVKNKWFYYLLYPFFKYTDRETLTYVLKKTS